ncbi:response regulator [Variovorax sp. J31P179]|uniref:response regulator n=1 Tax=Variovorax sp. J31P179 TaxID=3053508 RepID=UPI0025762BF4|nr:response regulator [Variovorax sp. J31P179]MDM0085544.1 response regulator [Variovorax sp. J31P179]
MAPAFEILVLDDERESADMLGEILALQFEGARVRVAYSGEDAVAFGTERRPDLAILDLEMGGLDGEGAAHALRSAYPDVGLLLIALSGNVVRLAELRMKGTFDHLLSKPVDLEALFGLVTRQVLAR